MAGRGHHRNLADRGRVLALFVPGGPGRRIFAPVYYVFGSGAAWHARLEVGLAIAVISALLFYRHRANIARLLKGTESRIGKKK